MQIVDFLKQTIAGELSLEAQKDYLESKEDYSAAELAEAVNYLYENRAIKVELPGCIDICGTGGSGLQRINTSTIAVFLLARQGVKVAKHGNKAASGRFGSFDLLENLGVPFLDDPAQIQKEFEEKNVVFLYARSFYPIMKHFAPVRKVIAKPTFFNLLGPLLSPVKVEKQIIGTTFKDKMHLIVETTKLLGSKRVMVVSGSDGLDEVTLTGETQVVELKHGEINEYVIRPSDFGIDECKFEEIAGGDGEFNTQIAKDILEAKCESRHADLVGVNAALALHLAKDMDLKVAFKLVRS